MSSRQPDQASLAAASEEDAAKKVERPAGRALKKSASAPAPTAPAPVKRSSRNRWVPLFRDPTFGGSIGSHSGDHRKAKPTLKQSRSFVFEDEAEVLLTNDGRPRTGEAMPDRLQKAVWKIVVQDEEDKPDSPPTPSLLDVFAPPDSAHPRIDASSARKISRLSTGSAFSNISSMSRQSSAGAVPQLVSRTASDDPVSHFPSQDSRTSSSLVDSKESRGSGSVRASSKLSRDSHPRAPRLLRDIVRPTTPMESDLIALGSEVSDDSQASRGTSPWASEDLPSLSRSPKGTPRGSPKGSGQLAKLGSGLGSGSSLSPKPQQRGLPPSESKLSLPRTDSRLMRDKEESLRSPKPLDRASTGDLRGKSPRAEKTLLEMELLKSDSKSHKLLPGIHRKPSGEASAGELTGSRPQSRAASKQSESLDGMLLVAERRTPSKGVSEQSAGNLLPKQTMKGQQAKTPAEASELLS